MDSDCGVYALLNLATGKVYVGSTVGMAGRYEDHLSALRRGAHYNPYLQRAWNKDANEFAVAALELCPPEILRAREMAWITELQAADREYGYNLRQVCAEKWVHAPETCNKIRIANSTPTPEARARWERQRQRMLDQWATNPTLRARLENVNKHRITSPETRAKLSAVRLGNTNALGTVPSPETRAKLSAASRGRTHSPETRAKLSIINSNRSSETREKIRISRLGKKHSPETIAKLCAAWQVRKARKRAERAAIGHLDTPAQSE